MKIVKQTDIINTEALDITYASNRQIQLIKSVDLLVPLQCSYGSYGLSALLMRGIITGDLYKVETRCNNLFRVLENEA